MKMTYVVTAAALLFTVADAQARICDKDKKGDIADCVSALRTSHDKNGGKRQFVKDFDEVCQTNSKFKCTKVTVMGDLAKTEREYAADPDHKKATIFKVDYEEGKYLFLFEKK